MATTSIQASNLFNVEGLVAVITGGGSGKIMLCYVAARDIGPPALVRKIDGPECPSRLGTLDLEWTCCGSVPCAGSLEIISMMHFC